MDSFYKKALRSQIIELIEPNYIYSIRKVTNDSQFKNLWGLKNLKNLGIDIQAEKAWDVTTGSKSIIVAVVDTGVDINHPDLKSNIWTNKAELNGKPGIDDDGNGIIDDIYGYNSIDDNGNVNDGAGHGTHCAGTIGAIGNNNVGVVGVNWNVSIMPVKFLDDNGSGTSASAIKAINYATKMGARIISNSWGGGGYSVLLENAIKQSQLAGALFVAAAGNATNDNDSQPFYPATYNVANIVSVAAINKKGALASFSNYGKTTVDLGAPGVDILSTYPNNSYKSLSGTSMATPHVSGVAALLLAKKPNLTISQLKERLINTGTPLKSLKNKTSSGRLLNAQQALSGL